MDRYRLHHNVEVSTGFTQPRAEVPRPVPTEQSGATDLYPWL